MKRKKKRAGGDYRAARETASNDTNNILRADPPQVSRMRLTARCLGTPVVFVSDWPLVGELFDARGRHVSTWSW
jgi:hypothetical protein